MVRFEFFQFVSGRPERLVAGRGIPPVRSTYRSYVQPSADKAAPGYHYCVRFFIGEQRRRCLDEQINVTSAPMII